MRSLLKRAIIVISAVLFLKVILMCLAANGVSNIFNLNEVMSNAVALENTNNVAQIATSFCVIFGLIIAISQYVLTARAERVKMEVECIQKAIDLSEYYKNNILEKYAVILYVFEKTGMAEIIKSIRKDEINNFNETELNRLLTPPSLKKLQELKKSKEFIKVVMEADAIFELNFNLHKNIKIKKDDGGGELVMLIDESSVVRKFMSNIVTDTLNNLEYFSMNFTHRTAEETVVYQSLHQTYLEMIYILYYNIAIINKPDSGMYYTNVIELYKIWSKRNQKDVEKISGFQAKSTLKGAVAQKC